MKITKAKHDAIEVERGDDQLILRFKPTSLPETPIANLTGAVVVFFLLTGWHWASSLDGAVFWLTWAGMVVTPILIGGAWNLSMMNKRGSKWTTVILDSNSVTSAGRSRKRYDLSDIGKVYSKQNPVHFTHKGSDLESKQKAAEEKAALNYSVIADFGVDTIELVPPGLTEAQANQIRDEVHRWRSQ